MKKTFLYLCLIIKLCSQPSISPTPPLKPAPKIKTFQARLLFAGDMMFDRHIREIALKKGKDYPLKPLKNFLKQYDLVIANLEGPITTFPSVSIGSIPGSRQNYVFTFPKYVSEILSEYNIKIVNLGNNHILNFGEKGFEQTKSFLSKNSIDYFGFVSEKKFDKVLIKQINHITFAFVNYNQFSSNSSQSALKRIENLKNKVDFIILYTHWGNEYTKTASSQITQQAHMFVDAGADLIIGSHPHVIQNKENYKGKTIYYSLGNFVFDQYFSEEVKTGLLVELNLQKKGKNLKTKFKEFKVRIEKGKDLMLIIN